MLAPEHVSSRFLVSYQALLGRVAGKRLGGVDDFGRARKRLFTEAECLRAAVSDDAELIAALRTAVFGKVMVARHLKGGTEMIDHRDGIHLVLGLTTPLREMAWPWSVIETMICRYRGFCICDGLIVELGIAIGPNMKRDILARVRASCASSGAPWASGDAPQTEKERAVEGCRWFRNHASAERPRRPIQVRAAASICGCSLLPLPGLRGVRPKRKRKGP